VADLTDEWITVDLIIPQIEDSWKPGAELALTYSWKIDRHSVHTVQDLLYAIRNTILLAFETHEMDEWFFYKGVRVTPVHEETDAATD
jgi:hypothetical protein